MHTRSLLKFSTGMKFFPIICSKPCTDQVFHIAWSTGVYSNFVPTCPLFNAIHGLGNKNNAVDINQLTLSTNSAFFNNVLTQDAIAWLLWKDKPNFAYGKFSVYVTTSFKPIAVNYFLSFSYPKAVVPHHDFTLDFHLTEILYKQGFRQQTGKENCQWRFLSCVGACNFWRRHLRSRETSEKYVVVAIYRFPYHFIHKIISE